MMNKQLRTLADVKTHVYDEQAAKNISGCKNTCL